MWLQRDFAQAEPACDWHKYREFAVSVRPTADAADTNSADFSGSSSSSSSSAVPASDAEQSWQANTHVNIDAQGETVNCGGLLRRLPA